MKRLLIVLLAMCLVIPSYAETPAAATAEEPETYTLPEAPQKEQMGDW